MLEEKLAEVELKTLTPSLLGGYDTGSYSYTLGEDFHEVPRPPAIKGCLRWWLRALLAGALWEAGKSEKVILEGEAGKRVGRIFGTTYPPEESSISKILLHVDGSEFIPTLPKPVEDSIPRLKLLIQGYGRGRKNWRLSCFPEGLKFKLSFYLWPKSKLEKEERETVMWTIALYSIFGGIGAMTRRGFGALGLAKEPSFFKEVLSNFLDYDKITSELIKETVEKALESAHKLLGTSPGKREGTPPFPVLVRSDDEFKTEIKEVKARNPVDLLVKLGNCTLKVKWKKRIQERGYPYDTWILGLPRKGKLRLPRKGKTPPRYLDTGYIVKGEHERRAGAICLKPLARKGENWKILVYGFLSSDWPPKIEHHSAKPRWGDWEPLQPKSVEKKPEEAFREAWKKVLSLLGEKNESF